MATTFHPGAAKYGNFINYYEFNSPEARLQLMQDGLMSTLCCQPTPVVMLDVGCNAGVRYGDQFRNFRDQIAQKLLDMTTALYKHVVGISETSHVKEVHMLGIDLDTTLIERADEKNPDPKNIRFSVCDVTLPGSNEQLTSYLEEFKKPAFDFGFCLSISMWIHLNHGDDGLRSFLLKISSLVKYLVIEPQPWKCYKSAVRRMHRLDKEGFSHFGTLRHRDDIVDYIKTYLTEDCNMTLVSCFGETSWGRPIWLFKSNAFES